MTFSDEELKSMYTVFCALDFLPIPQWELKVKIEQHLSKTLTLKEIKALSDESKALIPVRDHIKR